MCHAFGTGGTDDCTLNMLTHKNHFEMTKMSLMAIGTNKMSLLPSSLQNTKRSKSNFTRDGMERGV
jgi:hypothetical protein